MGESAAASILQPVVDEVVKCISAVVKRQFNYLCCFTTNVNGLEDEAKTLDDATQGVQGKVERERENAQDIVPAVETWLADSNDFKAKVNGLLLNEVPKVKSGCFKLTARYSLSKKAMKTAEAMKEHRQKWTEIASNDISHPKPPAAAVQIPLVGGTAYEFESRKQIEEKIMTCLKGDDRDMIGISGMGGLGKTTMANKIRNRALEEHVFDEVVMAVVSQQVDESKIQQQIAEQLSLKLEEQTLMARANRLRERLHDSKRTLLILDDVWERLKLVELGIPCGSSQGCRVLFTSRNRDALSGMDVGKVFGMEILSEEEAWLLFRGKAGTCVDDTRLNPRAKEVVRECRGLPIALVTVGAAMKDEMDEGIWKDAVKQLRKANPKNIPEFIKEVYKPLEVSYTKLASEEAKSLFLLCCLFPEDDNISVDELTYFCMGLHILEDVMSLEDARDRMCGLIKMLKSRSLLLDGDYEYYDCVRMHDVVRDVCTFIAKQKGYIERSEFPVGLGFPNLRLLVLTKDHFSDEDEQMKININNFFEGIRDLYVLSMSGYPWTSLPPVPTQSLKNLGTLILYYCEKLETISVVGDLVNLEILICFNCDLIKELPVEMGRLNRLKLLDIWECFNLQSIGRGIISSLVGLEELKVRRSFKKWEAEDIKERKNAGLRELESLTNLTCLEIEIEDAALTAQNMRLSSNLKRFNITVGPQQSFDLNSHGRSYGLNKNIMELRWVEGTCLGDWIQMLLFTNLSVIHIEGSPRLHNLGQLSIAGLPHLESLSIMKCKAMEQVFLWNQEEEEEENKNDHITKILFPKLKEVLLESLPNLTTFCQGIEGIEFPLLEEMDIDECPKMTSMISSCCVNRIGSNENNSGGRSNEDHSSHLFCQQEKVSFVSLKILKISAVGSMSLFTSSIAGSFVSLRELSIRHCSEMEQVIKEEEGEEKTVSGGERRTLVFPNLQWIYLLDLPKLVTFCESKCDFEFPSLTSMKIQYCPHLHSLGQLSIAGNDCLPHLEFLTIENCKVMEQVFLWNQEEEEENKNDHITKILFPKLEEVELYRLPNLTTFCQGIEGIEFPLLERMDIHFCPKMTSMISICFVKRIGSNEDHSSHLFCQQEKVSFVSLKILRISAVGSENPFCCHKIPMSFFNGLEELTISRYHGSMSLFTSSIAGSLVSLRELSILKCSEMEQVIKEEEVEEKTVSGGERRTLVFPNLLRIVLNGLPKLVMFCEWNCDIELPSLKRVVINRCPNMRNVTLGPLTTPILANITIDRKGVGATKDLNGLLQQRFGRAKEAKEEVEQENENEEEKPSNFINIKEIKGEQEEEEENKNEKDQEEKQSNVINNNEIKSEQEDKHMKGEIEEEQK